MCICIVHDCVGIDISRFDSACVYVCMTLSMNMVCRYKYDRCLSHCLTCVVTTLNSEYDFKLELENQNALKVIV